MNENNANVLVRPEPCDCDCNCEQPQARRPEPFVDKSDNKIRPISIKEMHYGYIVEVGCKSFCIESASKLVAKLAEYINNPAATEQKWYDGKLF